MLTTIQLYGIKNCDTVKKARKWLESHSIAYDFNDFRVQSMSADKLQAWLDKVGAEVLINRRSTTWKQLSSDEKSKLDQGSWSIVLANPTLIKRPVLEYGDGKLLIGFNEEDYAALA
ncbi:ArsC family reductase [Teredinibacter waterburyi]|jgi:transcriptional regulator, Spx/MgsR family|uniref:ArsC family reductase n=1 Tax=Teredinibacter waterburyi TaxID=1500538 RepID=UPI00165F6DED|nr:ArsC family reductase [Teredinibacter waterburyi]